MVLVRHTHTHRVYGVVYRAVGALGTLGSLFRYLWRTSRSQHAGGREDVVTTADVQTALGHLPPRMKHLPASVLTQLQEERKKVGEPRGTQNWRDDSSPSSCPHDASSVPWSSPPSLQRS